MKRLTLLCVLALAAAIVVPVSAQQERPLGPAGTATAMVGGQWTKNAEGNPIYQGGKWIEIA